jgi:putative acetyltransferase
MGVIMTVNLRSITSADNADLARIIRTVMPEFGANAPGFAIHDPEVDRMFETYQLPRSFYYVCDVEGKIMGGAGVAPLKNGDPSICELQKMYFLPEIRGIGIGRKLLHMCLAGAKLNGFNKCYLETFHSMSSAIRLYEANGFKLISGSLGQTGHFGCDTFYIRDLSDYFPPENM